MSIRNCGECLMNDVEIVQLRGDGKCPRCGADYGPHTPIMAKDDRKPLKLEGPFKGKANADKS